jgi:hypothetical protein
VKKKHKDSFSQRLSITRIVLDPLEMIGFGDFRMMSPKCVGVLLRLLPYAVSNPLPLRLSQMAPLGGVSAAVLKRAWPTIASCFDRSEAGWRLREASWFRIQTITTDRQRLRHLLDRLVSFWGSACVYCGAEAGELEIEHIVPVVRGGSDDLTNLTLSCKACNLKKRTQTAAEFGFPHIHDWAKRIQ